MQQIKIRVECADAPLHNASFSIAAGSSLPQLLSRCSQGLGREVLSLYDASGRRLLDARDLSEGAILRASLNAFSLNFAGATHQSAAPTRLFSFSVAVLGPPGAGKTALALRFARGTFNESSPAAASATYVRSIDLQGGTYSVSVFDIAGQDNLQPLRARRIEDQDAIVLVVGADGCQEAEEDAHLHSASFPAHVTVALVVAKCDLLDRSRNAAQKRQRIANLGALAREREWLFCETSAKRNSNVMRVFAGLIERHYGLEAQPAPPPSPDQPPWSFRLCGFPFFWAADSR